ncbi:MAG: PDZ domain-containing protein [Cyanobacteria bacterium P01_F01_bin.53]
MKSNNSLESNFGTLVGWGTILMGIAAILTFSADIDISRWRKASRTPDLSIKPDHVTPNFSSTTSSVGRPSIGIRVITASPQEIEDLNASPDMQYDLPKKASVVIVDVDDDSPADKGGLKAFDIITQIEGKDIISAKQVETIIKDSEPTQALQFEVIRQPNNQVQEVFIHPEVIKGIHTRMRWATTPYPS